MLQIYADAGYWQGTAYAATLILENGDTQVVFFCKRYNNISTCAEAEIIGIEQSMSWVCQNRPDIKEIAIYCDNLGVAQKLCNYVDSGIIGKGAYAALWMHLYTLCDKFEKIDVFHIEAHQPEHNPNMACDFLCHALIRMLMEESKCMP